MTTIKYDYSKYKDVKNWDYNVLQEKDFFGVHEINGRIEIDIERYKIACDIVGIKDFMPKEIFKDSNIKYYTPTKEKRYDYIVNLYVDSLNEFINKWNNEYKPLFKSIITPKQVEDNYRFDSLMYTSCSDDYDDICVDAAMEGFKRIESYHHIINELNCIFISKVCTEVDRISLLAMAKLGYKGLDFTFDDFKEFSNKALKGKRVKFDDLKKYNAYRMLHRINNFLKHNSEESYKKLKQNYPENVRTDSEYKNGMFACDWVILKENYIDDVLNKLLIFFKDYCLNFYEEDYNNAKWDYDDYFINALKEMSDPYEYYGIWLGIWQKV